MKTKITPAFYTAIIISAITFSAASAEGLYDSIDLDTSVKIKAQENNNREGEIESSVRVNSTTTKERDDDGTEVEVTNDKATTSKNIRDDHDGQATAEIHRSTVASFVHSLLDIANREGGIGAQVRVIAQNQNESATTTTAAIAKVEEKGALRTFFFGSDFRNLGIIRGELATTSNNIAQLKALLSGTTNTADRVELNAQIQALESEQARLDAYVTAHENIFSLFGWFAKLIVK